MSRSAGLFVVAVVLSCIACSSSADQALDAQTGDTDALVGNDDARTNGDAATDSDAGADALIVDCSVAPGAVPAALGLDPFYKKYLDIGGLPLVSSDQVANAAFQPACLILVHMLQRLPQARASLLATAVRVGIMAATEVTTDMPEHSDLNEVFPGTDWDTRARGLGATLQRPLASVGEENLLKLPTDVFAGESILVHEFGHTVFELGIARASGGAGHAAMLTQLYGAAQTAGLWADTYAITNEKEYWAETVQSWFGVNIEGGFGHNDIDTRAELLSYDPNMAAFIGQFFVEQDAPF